MEKTAVDKIFDLLTVTIPELDPELPVSIDYAGDDKFCLTTFFEAHVIVSYEAIVKRKGSAEDFINYLRVKIVESLNEQIKFHSTKVSNLLERMS